MRSSRCRAGVDARLALAQHPAVQRRGQGLSLCAALRRTCRCRDAASAGVIIPPGGCALLRDRSAALHVVRVDVDSGRGAEYGFDPSTVGVVDELRSRRRSLADHWGSRFSMTI